MQSVIRFSIRQKVFFNLIFVVLILAGSYAMLNIPSDRYPSVNFGEVVISTYYPGASPTEVETLVTREIEEALESVDNISWIKSTSFRERSRIHLKFIDDTDYEAGFNEVRLNILNQLEQLPPEADPPEMTNISTEDFLPVVVVNLTGEHENRLLTLVAEELKPQLKQIPGVKEIKLLGEHEREFHVYLDPRRLRSLGISFDDVSRALEQTNISIPAGDFHDSSGEFTVRVDEKFRSREQVLATIIRTDSDGSFVRVQDVISQAGLRYQDPQVISSVNGQPSIALQVLKDPNGNALDIREQVDILVRQFRSVTDSHGIEVVMTQDSTIHIVDGLNTLGMNLLFGIILVSLIIWYFMGLRNSGLITIGIPFSFMLTMLLMYLTGNSINELTLFSFVLVTGIIVDDAIVVTENIYRHIEQGRSLQEAIVTGAAEVALPVISATLTTIAAFMPMLIMTGVTGEFFRLIPTTVSFAILASLVECLLILPIHYLDFGPDAGDRSQTAVKSRETRMMEILLGLTLRILKHTLKHRFWSLFAVLVAFLVAMSIMFVSITGIAPLIRIKFFPDDYTLYYVDVEGDSSKSIEEIDQQVRAISEFIVADGPGYVDASAGMAGFYYNEDYEQIFGNQYGTVMIALPSRDLRAFDSPLQHLERMEQRIREKFENDGFRLSVHAQKDGPPQGKDLNVRIQGSNIDSVNGLATELMRFISGNPQIAPELLGLKDNRGQSRRIVRFHVRHERAREYGLNGEDVARLAASVLDGRVSGRYRLADEEIDLKLFIDPQTLKSPEDALYIPLQEHPTGPLRLADVTRIQTYMEPGELFRYEYQRAISIQANLKPSSSISIPVIIDRIQRHYESVRARYPGATVSYAGEHEDTRRSYTSLTYAFILALMLIYVILATQFQSYVQPLIILSSVIFALIGVIFGKALSQTVFTLNSFIAVIGVAGVVVNDALVLVDFINRHHRSGASRHEAITYGISVRLRPIVLTTLTTSLGLLPMAVGFPSYSLVWGSMASTFVAGLATATTLTLIIVPVLWDLTLEMQQKVPYQLHSFFQRFK